MNSFLYSFRTWLALGIALAPSIGCAHDASAQMRREQATSVGTIEPLELHPDFNYFSGLQFNDEIPTPASILGYEIGDRFTRHADVHRYLEALSMTSDRVDIRIYGGTNEGRALSYLVITSPANHARLDEILSRNRALADPRATSESRARDIIDSNPAIAWFSYNVHGNEASSSESAMWLAYTLAAGKNPEIVDILEKVVLIIDPMINPDGRDRYVEWYNQTLGVGQGPNPNPDAAEHDEPWPGGRTNHYYFDLNRDWLWLTQVESQQRMAAYRTIRPQLHIDYHEQGARSPYFFGAGDDPYNTNIPDETRRWINLYGEANARVFDQRGLVYATRERFDYLYPGYGKVLPVYHGAIGLLCEQAGHGFAGLAVDIMGDYTLTLRQRAHHHFLTAMSYLETTADNRAAQLERYRRFFTESMTPTHDGARAFIITPDNDPALLEKAWMICSTHGIEIETLDDPAIIPNLKSYQTGETTDRSELPSGTWIIRVDQPMGRLAKAIFERESEITDIDTYDITAWSLPVLFGLDAAYTDVAPRAQTTRLADWAAPTASLTGDGDVALVIDARQTRFPTAVGLAVRHDLFARRTGGIVKTSDGAMFGAGSLIVHRIRNHPEQLGNFIDDCLAAGINIHKTGTGLTLEGHVLGANDNALFELPRVLLLRGQPISGNSYGQHWWLLDHEQPIPYTAMNVEAMPRADLSKYNVMVMPDMFGSLDDRAAKSISDWVRAGGTLIASGPSALWAAREVVGIKTTADDPETEKKAPKPNQLSFAEREAQRVEARVPGALLRVNIDTSHPLASGVHDWIGVLMRSDRILPVADNGYVVARFAGSEENPDAIRIGGSISTKNRTAMARKPFMTQHRVGRGAVISFADDQTFRGFHHAGMRLLLNAIVGGPNL